jgi:hypothetical protein
MRSVFVSRRSQPRHKIEVSGDLHYLAAELPGKNILVPVDARIVLDA